MKSRLFLLLVFMGSFGALLAGGGSPSNFKRAPMLKQRLHLEFSVVDFPQNFLPNGHFPSMRQSLQMSNNFYELGYWGIESLRDVIIQNRETRFRRILHRGLGYALSLPFVRWGSDLPIPLGTWAHEEFHRSVLGLQGLPSYNGNWLLRRWDGTVFGTSDAELQAMKSNDLPNLLHAYTAGIEAQNAISRTNALHDFFTDRTIHKNALYLYNAWYVWNYFRGSCGPASDAVKGFAPDFLPEDQRQRDFAGLDLTAWAYDMTEPNADYLSRDTLPGLTGVNRYVGFSDLQSGAQKFLVRQRNLSLLNFLQPAIFFKNRFELGPSLRATFMVQYAPTPFGNSISLTVPFTLKANRNYFVGLHTYNNNSKHFPGLELGIYKWPVAANQKLSLTASLQGWMQPKGQDFFATESELGGGVAVRGDYSFHRMLSAFAGLQAKTNGWQLANPYLGSNLSADAGIAMHLWSSRYAW
ncbi:MAG TPA: hypothetical protein VHS96_16830 [Bacteroidia bacterium]|nr:hypothetical protein [Bacteroidia bacterium]